MSTFDQVIIDDRDLVNRYFGDTNFDDDQFGLPNIRSNTLRPLDTRINPSSDFLTDNDTSGLLGRRVFLESPSFGNKDEEDIYRFVPSRLSDNPVSLPAPNGDTLIDSLDFELNVLGATNLTRPLAFENNSRFIRDPKPLLPSTQIKNPTIDKPTESNLVRSDPRQDPLLGPLLAELDALSNQQKRFDAPPVAPRLRRNSLPYAANGNRPNDTFANPPNRTVTDAFLETQLYDSLETRDNQDIRIPSVQQRQPIPYSAPSLNSNAQHIHNQVSAPPRTTNMTGTDFFIPSSFNTGPTTFLSNFGPEDQLFQQPLFNAIGQNYVSNPRQQPVGQQQRPNFEQRDPSFDNSFGRTSPPVRNNYQPSRQFDDFQRQPVGPPPPSINQRQPAYNNNTDRYSDYQDPYPPTNSRLQPPPSQRTGVPSVNSNHPRITTQQQQQQQQQQQFDTPKQPNSFPSTNRELFFTDHDDDQLEQVSYRQQPGAPSTGAASQRNSDENDQDSRRQAIWNELQRNNAKVQEKNAKKRESANRREQIIKGNYSGPTQSSAPAKTNNNPPVQRRPPPVPVPKANYIEENIDMIKNKENFYHRYPAKKYENLFSKRKDLVNGGQKAKQNNNFEHKQDTNEDYDEQEPNVYANPKQPNAGANDRSTLPVTINLNPGQASQTGSLPATVTIPLDSHVNRVGDKISVNIDLRLVDLQNLKQQQQQQQQQGGDQPDWSGLDPLDRHIRKLERSIDQSLPPTDIPVQRSSSLSNPNIPNSIGRYGKTTKGAGSGPTTYNPPSYAGDYYGYSDKVSEENSYLAKMTNTKAKTTFKPYDGKDYEKFKREHNFGGGFLGFDFDNPTYKEKSDKLAKTKEYAQVVDARNKKKLAEAPRRTLSDTRIPTESSKTQRAIDYAKVSTQHKHSSGNVTGSTPPELNQAYTNGENMRRPTEVPRRPPVPQKTNKSPPNDNDLVERLALRHEQEKAQVQGIMNPSQRRRDAQFDDDRNITDVERLAQDRAQQRRMPPVKPLPPSGPNPGANGRRPLRFDKPSFDDTPVSSTGQYQYPQSQTQPYSSQHGSSVSPSQSHPHNGPDRSANRRSQSPTSQRRGNERSSHRQGPGTDDHVDELANRHNDEKMLMEAIRMELSERPLADDEELIVIQE